MTRAQLLTLLTQKILTGGKRTTAQFIRDFETDAIASYINKTDDLNVAGGYLGADLVSARVIVGNSSGVGTARAISGDLSIDNAGVVTLSSDAVVLKSACIPLFNSFTDSGNSTTAETDLVSNTIAAGQLASAGDKIEAEYGGTFVTHATATRRIRVYFGGVALFDTTAVVISANSGWIVKCTIMMRSATTVRYMIQLVTVDSSRSVYTSVGEDSSLNLASTNILKITGQAGAAGAATNDIVLKLSQVNYIKKA